MMFALFLAASLATSAGPPVLDWIEAIETHDPEYLAEYDAFVFKDFVPGEYDPAWTQQGYSEQQLIESFGINGRAVSIREDGHSITVLDPKGLNFEGHHRYEVTPAPAGSSRHYYGFVGEEIILHSSTSYSEHGNVSCKVDEGISLLSRKPWHDWTSVQRREVAIITRSFLRDERSYCNYFDRDEEGYWGVWFDDKGRKYPFNGDEKQDGRKKVFVSPAEALARFHPHQVE